MPAWVLPAIQAGAGLVQSLFGGGRARKAQRELERMQSPVYSGSQSIMDYYNQALQRANTNPYDSSLYRMQSQNIQRGLSQGLGALRDRRMALQGVTGLVQQQNDALLKAAATAEGEQNRRFGELGQAASMKGNEEYKMFNINQLMPFERKSALLGAKAAGGSNIMNAGLSNIFGGLSSLGNMSFMKELYGSQGGKAVSIPEMPSPSTLRGAWVPSYFPPSKMNY